MKYVILEKAKGFRLSRHLMGKEETERARKERARTGEWTPSGERLREMARRRREEESPPEW